MRTAWATVVVAATLAACGGSGGGADAGRDAAACDRPPSEVSVPTVTAGPTTDARTEPLPTVEVRPTGGRTPLEGFGEVSAVVVDRPDGAAPVPLCLLVADTADQRARGLMGVVDPALGGYDGMVFLHEAERPAGHGYWMKDTPLPLSLAYLDARGGVVDTAELEPCPPATLDCPSYPSSAPFSMVLEVVRGGLEPLDLVAGSPARLRLPS